MRVRQHHPTGELLLCGIVKPLGWGFWTGQWLRSQCRLVLWSHSLNWGDFKSSSLNYIYTTNRKLLTASVNLESVHSLNSPNCSFRCVSAYPFCGQWWFPGFCLGVRSRMGLLRPKLRHSEPHPEAQTSCTPHHYQTVLGLEPKLHRERASLNKNFRTRLNSAILTLELQLSWV